MTDNPSELRLVIVSAGTSQPSTTRMLGDRIAQAGVDVLRGMNVRTSVAAIELGPLAVDIAGANVTGVPSDELKTAIDRVAAADALIASTPVYNAGVSGLFNLGTGRARTYLDLAHAVCDAAERPRQIEFIDMPKALVGQYQSFTQAPMERLRAAGYTVLWANARDTALGFYERVGMHVEGNGYVTTETGLPHHTVVLDLT